MQRQDIKEMYQEIKAPESAVEQLLEIPVQQRRGIHRGSMLGRLAVACLAAVVFIPAGVYAAGKISEYFQTKVTKQGYQVNTDIHGSGEISGERKYVKLDCRFDAAYTVEKKHKGMICYVHEDGFDAGRDFWYRLIRVDDEKKKMVLKSYDAGEVIETVRDGHKTLYYQTNEVVGSRYASDFDTCYNQHLFVFYDEYGYIVEFGGMQKLGRDGMYALAEQVTMQETDAGHADKSVSLSTYCKNPSTADRIEITYGQDKDVTEKIQPMNTDVVFDSDFTVSVTDVRLRDTVRGMSEDGFMEELDFVASLCDQDGKLKPYTRENLQFGDGITTPARSVANTEKIQPKLVCVTMKLKRKAGEKMYTEKEGDDWVAFGIPWIEFLAQEGDRVYLPGDYDYLESAKRPDQIENASMDNMACYFRESQGGKSALIVEDMKPGEERTLHFAYLVDEDMTDQVYLQLDWGYDGDPTKYIKLDEK